MIKFSDGSSTKRAPMGPKFSTKLNNVLCYMHIHKKHVVAAHVVFEKMCMLLSPSVTFDPALPCRVFIKHRHFSLILLFSHYGKGTSSSVPGLIFWLDRELPKGEKMWGFMVQCNTSKDKELNKPVNLKHKPCHIFRHFLHN